MSAFATLLRKELVDSLRDRRTLFIMIAVPVALYPLLLLALGGILSAGRDELKKAELTIGRVGSGAARVLSEARLPPRTRWTDLSRPAAEVALREKKVHAFVVMDRPPEPGGALPQAKATVVYTKRFDKSIEALERARAVLKAVSSEAARARMSVRGLPADFAEPLVTEEYDLDFQKDIGPLLASRLLPLVLLLMLFMGSFYAAVEVTAGEKERGTLETLLAAPVQPTTVMAAKYLTVCLLGIAVSLFNLAGMAVTFARGFHVADGVSVSVRMSAGQLSMLGLALTCASLAVGGASLVVASLARNFKEGQQLLTPLMMLGLVPALASLMPGLELNHRLALVPFLNVALLIKAVMLGTAHWSHAAVTCGSVLAVAAVCVMLAANAYQSERLRFGGAESWRELFRF